MLISIIIPAYNAEKYIWECLESVKACQSDKIECIIVNDGSLDGTKEICESFLSDSRFRLINKENSGVSDTRNIGMAEAAGEYLFFLDADDYIKAGSWEEILACAAEKEYDMIAFGYYSLFDNGKIAAEGFPDSQDMYDTKLMMLSTSMMNNCWGKLLRRKVIQENDLRYDNNLKTGEDAVFMIDFVEHSKKSQLRSTCVLYYRIHANSTMRKASPNEKLADFSVLFNRRNAYLDANNDETLAHAMRRMHFSCITDLFRAYAKSCKIWDVRQSYIMIIKNAVVSTILSEIKSVQLPLYKKLEYILIKHKFYTCLSIYFKIKSYF